MSYSLSFFVFSFIYFLLFRKKLFTNKFPLRILQTASFLSSYQQHQQRLLNLLTKYENTDRIFQETQQFWTAISIRADKLNRCIILQCDVLFYKLLSEILIPSDLPVLKESLIDYVKSFLFNWPISIERSMIGDIKDDRLNLARRFCSKVQRHLVFSTFVQKSRCILFDGDKVRSVLNELECSISCLNKEYHCLDYNFTVLNIKGKIFRIFYRINNRWQ